MNVRWRAPAASGRGLTVVPVPDCEPEAEAKLQFPLLQSVQQDVLQQEVSQHDTQDVQGEQHADEE